jgi:hypothetical protein
LVKEITALRSGKKSINSIRQFVEMANLALPDRQHTPSASSQLSRRAPVTGNIVGEFLLPEGSSGFWLSFTVNARMPVPKTSMHENHPMTAGKHKVRRSWQSSSV